VKTQASDESFNSLEYRKDFTLEVLTEKEGFETELLKRYFWILSLRKFKVKFVSAFEKEFLCMVEVGVGD
jgi:transcription initiation factor IIE alpha subunit